MSLICLLNIIKFFPLGWLNSLLYIDSRVLGKSYHVYSTRWIIPLLLTLGLCTFKLLVVLGLVGLLHELLKSYPTICALQSPSYQVHIKTQLLNLLLA